MNISNVVFMGLFVVLSFFKSSGYISRVIALGYVIYYFFIADLPGEYYYHYSALLNLAIGVILIKKYISGIQENKQDPHTRFLLISLLSFSLTIANTAGFIMYEHYQSHDSYSSISLLIILAQIIILILGNLLNGIDVKGGNIMAYCNGRLAVLLATISNSKVLHIKGAKNQTEIQK